MRSFKHDSPGARRKTPHHLPSATNTPQWSSQPHKPGPDAHRRDATSLFVEDRKGDRQNLAYGSLDRYAVPRYRACGGGAVLGLGPKYRITRRTETRYEVENVELDSTRRTRRQSLLSNMVNDDSATVRPIPAANNLDDLQKGFLRFEHGHSRKRKRTGTRLDEGLSESEGESSTSLDPENTSETEDPFETFKKDPVHQRHMELSRATVETPQDFRVWLAFIDYQQTSFGYEHGSRGLGMTSGRSLIDLRLSLYEQALSHVKDPEGRQTLILGMMQEGSKIWDAEKQASQWRTFLNKDSSFDLWILYLNFMQSNQVRFTFETCLGIYKTCLKNFQDVEVERRRDSHCIYLLLRCTLYLWQSGFTEQAVGIWQALFEYNLFRPQNSTSEEPLESFHQFWASEVARIGEEGATGWSSMTSAELDAKSDKQNPHTPTLDFAAWGAAENDLGRCAGLPARSLDDVSEADPYRVLLFADIKDFLFTPGTQEGLRMLQDAFLLFAGLPALSTLPETRNWKGDPFVYDHSYSVPDWRMSIERHGDQFHMRESFSGGNSSSPLGDLSRPRTLAELHLDFVRRFLLQASTSPRRGGCDESLAGYAIAMEACLDLKSAKKQAKVFLKQNPDSLPLYNTYAVLEYRLGNFEAAERVWSTATSMRASLGPDAENAVSPLWRAWVYSYMTRNRYHEAEVLLGMLTDRQVDVSKLQTVVPGDHAQSIAIRIKTEQYLQNQFESLLSKLDTRLLPDLVDVLALQRYLTRGLSPEAALEIYEHCLEAIVGRGAWDTAGVEAIHENRARLLHSHATTFGKPYKPKEFCLVLTESVRAFPDNSFLLMLQHHYAQKSGLFDRLRQADSRAQATQRNHRVTDSVIPCIFGLSTELGRPSYAGSTNHSIRSAFRRATDQSEVGYHCVFVWKAYMMWELSVVSGEKSDIGQRMTAAEAKKRHGLQMVTDVFYSSLRACPWSKELYMLAFTQQTLRNSLGHQGLKQVYESMQDRGLRLHVDLSEQF
ncbi:hypothetical protein A1O1_07038 [Capronia coronata CBS 617.96]|uniref:DUF1740-domain-containing protein n=1 Tax=Capronia coronata CBS 617.96 TaxID=1182541 RepID=W9Y1C6_9EURO|nr:uncharacterized protein A1O1_07038 [Capronia coronata CBS 617.96]EXJ83415.1 hypothetical protein A1O1_07038 [Capronia coronata CBS 617.96]